MRSVRGSYILWEGRKGVGGLDDGWMKGCDGVGGGENKAKASTHWGPITYKSKRHRDTESKNQFEAKAKAKKMYYLSCHDKSCWHMSHFADGARTSFAQFPVLDHILWAKGIVHEWIGSSRSPRRFRDASYRSRVPISA